MREFKLKQWNGWRIYVKEILTLTEEEKLKNPRLWSKNNVGDKREVDCEGYIEKNEDRKFVIKFVKNEYLKDLYQQIIDNKIIEGFRDNHKSVELNSAKIMCGYVEYI